MRIAAIIAFWLGTLLPITGAEPPTAISPGATREEVINALGRPTGESRLGTREVLNYPQGQVSLENGRVVRVEFSKKGTPVASRPSAPSGPAVQAGAIPPDRWLTDFDVALREAARRAVPVLALFYGPEGSALSRQFLEQVASHPEFVRTFSPDYVLLRIDFPIPPTAPGRPATPSDTLRTRFGVAEFPLVVFLTGSGERLATVDFSVSPPEGIRRADAIARLREMRAKIALATGFAAAPAKEQKNPDTTSPMEMDRLSPFALKVGMRSTQALIVSASVAGLAIACFIGWLLWRTRAKPRAYQGPVLAARISEASSGIPTLPEILTWPKKQVCVLAAVLAESEGYEAEIISGADDKDVFLTRRGEVMASVVVCCTPGSAGTVTARNVRELLATVTAERMKSGWFVSPAGFSNDARAYAAQHKLLLIDGAHLISRLRDLPPILLPKLQTNRPW